MANVLGQLLSDVGERVSQLRDDAADTMNRLTCSIGSGIDREGTKTILSQATLAFNNIKRLDEGLREVRNPNWREEILKGIRDAIGRYTVSPNRDLADVGYYILAIQALFEDNRRSDPNSIGQMDIRKCHGQQMSFDSESRKVIQSDEEYAYIQKIVRSNGSLLDGLCF